MSEGNNGDEIPEGRQAIYYFGCVLGVVGFVLFLRPCLAIASFITNMFPGRGFSPPGSPGFGTLTSYSIDLVTPLIGFILCIVAGIFISIGRAGLAGSGIVLDPKQQRQGMKPWTHMAGGMLEDTLGASPTVQRFAEGATGAAPTEVVKVRCPHCRALNDETAKSCDQCGQAM